MKELSIEEKAKAYDEAIERANGLLYVSDKESLQRKTIESILPELKESESEDERMKKIISDILLIDSDEIREILNSNNVLMQDIDAWLEKKGEQKLTPIFRIGDIIIAKEGTSIMKEPFHIDSTEDGCYWDGENTILICNQDEFELVEHKPADKIVEKARTEKQ